MNLCSLKTIKELMDEYNFAPKKGYGQNFLINPAVPERIAESAAENEDCCILEIGPGIGTLTSELAQRYKKITAVEIDTALIPVLSRTLEDFDNVNIVHADFMKLNLPEFVDGEFGSEPLSICANLPYYITTPIIMNLLENGNASLFESVTVMIQTEVASRFTAKPGTSEYGAITAALNYYGEVRKLFDVSAGNFHPAPKVNSTVVQLVPYKKPVYHAENEKFLFEIITASFGQRRKTLLNALSSGIKSMTKEEIAKGIEESGLDSGIRGEKLSIQQFTDLSNSLFRLKNKL